MEETPLFRRGQRVVVVGFDLETRNPTRGLIILGEGTIYRRDFNGTGTYVRYHVDLQPDEGGPYAFSPRISINASRAFRTRPEAAEACAAWWDDRAREAERRAAEIRERGYT